MSVINFNFMLCGLIEAMAGNINVTESVNGHPHNSSPNIMLTTTARMVCAKCVLVSIICCYMTIDAESNVLQISLVKCKTKLICKTLV